LVYYDFDQLGSASEFNDGTLGASANLILTNGATRTLEGYGVSGQLGDFAYLSRTNTAQAITSGTVTGLNNRALLTISGWLKPYAMPEDRMIIGNWDGTNGFAVMTSSNKPSLMLASGPGTAVASTNNLLSSGTWNFFAITFDAGSSSPDAVKFYGGNIANSIYLADAQSRGSLTATLATNNPLRVGGTGLLAFNGEIDDLRIFEGILTADAIETIRRDGATRLTGTGEPPVIDVQPQDASLVAGVQHVLSVSAEAVPLPSYQWRKLGQNIPGANSASFTLPAVGPGDVGGYDVVVFNAFGSVTSEVAVITLGGAIAFVRQPVDEHIYYGDDAHFAAEVTSTNATFVWLRNNGTVSGATNRILTIQDVMDTSEPAYLVIASDETGSITSAVVRLYLYDLAFEAGAAKPIEPVVGGRLIRWPGLEDYRYDLLWSSNLLLGVDGFIPLAMDVPAAFPLNVVTDAVHGANNHGFYRLDARKDTPP
jgi:hypothetical protein